MPETPRGERKQLSVGPIDRRYSVQMPEFPEGVGITEEGLEHWKSSLERVPAQPGLYDSSGYGHIPRDWNELVAAVTNRYRLKVRGPQSTFWYGDRGATKGYINEVADVVAEKPKNTFRPAVIENLRGEFAGAYVEAAVGYSSLQVAVAESLNIDDVEARKAHVYRALEAMLIKNRRVGHHQFVEVVQGEHPDNSSDDVCRSMIVQVYGASPVTARIPDGYLRHFNEKRLYDERFGVQNPQELDRHRATLLLYAVLSVVNSPTEVVSPQGRVRALELLGDDKYKSAVLSNALLRDGSFARQYSAVVPDSMQSPQERASGGRSSWKENSHIQSLIVRNDKGINTEATAQRILTDVAPEEAVQIAMLFMTDPETADVGVSMLRVIPVLQQNVKERIFGPQASFLIQQKIEAGDKLLQALGVERNDASAADRELNEIDDPDALRKIALMERRRAERAEEREILLRMDYAKSLWERDELLVELATLRAAAQRPEASSSRESAEDLRRKDPLGYYKRLRLHPDTLRGLPEDVVTSIVKSNFRHLARATRIDQGAAGRTTAENRAQEAAFMALREVYEVLVDPKGRADYGDGLRNIV